MHHVAAPVAVLVAVGVHGEVAVVELRVVDVPVHGNLVENFHVALVFAKPSDLAQSPRVNDGSRMRDSKQEGRRINDEIARNRANKEAIQKAKRLRVLP